MGNAFHKSTTIDNPFNVQYLVLDSVGFCADWKEQASFWVVRTAWFLHMCYRTEFLKSFEANSSWLIMWAVVVYFNRVYLPCRSLVSAAKLRNGFDWLAWFLIASLKGTSHPTSTYERGKKNFKWGANDWQLKCQLTGSSTRTKNKRELRFLYLSFSSFYFRFLIASGLSGETQNTAKLCRTKNWRAKKPVEIGFRPSSSDSSSPLWSMCVAKVRLFPTVWCKKWRRAAVV